MRQPLLHLAFFLLASGVLVGRVHAIDLYARTLADSTVTGWDREDHLLRNPYTDTTFGPPCGDCSTCCFRDSGVPSRINCSASSPQVPSGSNGYAGVYLTVNGWDSWSLGSEVITQVSVSVLCAYRNDSTSNSTSGVMRLRINGPPGILRTVSGGCGWEPELVIDPPAGGWTKAAVDSLTIGVARDSDTSPNGALYVDAVRLRVTTATTGACCFAGGSCAILTADQCSGQSGSYRGDNIACNPCPQPTGACCFSSGACSLLTAAQCATQTGSYRGDDIACNPCPQPTGACCFSSGACSLLTAAQCATQTGSYRGDNMACNTCPQPVGACCFPAGDCSVFTAAQCTAQSGSYRGDNVVCNPCPRPPIACCFATGTCLVLSEADCANQGGRSRGTDAVCGSCPTWYFCCTPVGTCVGPSPILYGCFGVGWAMDAAAPAPCSPCASFALVPAGEPNSVGLYQSSYSPSVPGIGGANFSGSRLWAATETSGGLGPDRSSAYAAAALTADSLWYMIREVRNTPALPPSEPPISVSAFASVTVPFIATRPLKLVATRAIDEMYGLAILGPGRVGFRLRPGSYGLYARASVGGTGPGQSTSEATDSIALSSTTCAADVDQAVGLSVNDLFYFLQLFFKPPDGSVFPYGYADFNASGTTTVQDVFDYLEAFLQGC